MTDDEFKPRPVAPPRPAIPINPNASPPVDPEPWDGPDYETGAIAPNNPYDRMGTGPKTDPERSARAKRAWEKRRKGTPDRHAVGDHPFDAAIAELYRQRVLIDEAIKMLEDRRGAK